MYSNTIIFYLDAEGEEEREGGRESGCVSCHIGLALLEEGGVLQRSKFSCGVASEQDPSFLV